LPKAVAPAGTSRVTTLQAPIKASSPDGAPDVDWATKLQPRGPPGRIARVIGREDLNSRADLHFVADGDLYDV
jgi:hypothetical protein